VQQTTGLLIKRLPFSAHAGHLQGILSKLLIYYATCSGQLSFELSVGQKSATREMHSVAHWGGGCTTGHVKLFVSAQCTTVLLLPINCHLRHCRVILETTPSLNWAVMIVWNCSVLYCVQRFYTYTLSKHTHMTSSYRCTSVPADLGLDV